MSAISRGYYLIILPWIYTIIIPIFLTYCFIYPDSNTFYYNLGIVIASVLLTWNGVELFFVFIYRKTNLEKSQNALDSKQIIRYVVLGSITLLIISVIMDILMIEKIIPVLSGTIEEAHERFIIFATASFFSMLFSTIPYVPLVMHRNFSRGQSFTHFQAGLKVKNPRLKIENYQLGIDDYNRYLREILGVRFKEIDKIHSSIITENFSTLDSKIRHLLESFNDPIKPAKILCSRVEYKSEDFFETIKPYEHLEKWLKYGAPLIPIIPVIITVYFQYFNNS